MMYRAICLGFVVCVSSLMGVQENSLEENHNELSFGNHAKIVLIPCLSKEAPQYANELHQSGYYLQCDDATFFFNNGQWYKIIYDIVNDSEQYLPIDYCPYCDHEN